MRLTLLAVICASTVVATQSDQPVAPVPLTRFVEATGEDERTANAALREIAASWKNSYTSMFVDLARMMRPPRGTSDEPLTPGSNSVDDADGDAGNGNARPSGLMPGVPDRGSPIRRRLLSFLEKQTGKRFGNDLNAWRTWMWSLPYDPHPDYARLKAAIYAQVDPRMQAFFPQGVKSTIRLDEIDWGGVKVNGIPPLRSPRIVNASDARYLSDSNVVFGLVVNGEARAYPKRILAWHEMAIDKIGGVDLTIVYCTLCGTVIPYESSVDGRTLQFGTSGLLYQSNKLMFDEGSNSLWSTFEGKPVVGSLVGSGSVLRTRPVVTTTWKEWRATHPTTSVLSLDTGYDRDYSEGAAYREYFASDRLMFQVSRTDARLPNKAEVVVLRLPDGASDTLIPVAIDVRFLRAHPVYSFAAGGQRYTVVTSAAGANQVYRTVAEIPEQKTASSLADRSGRHWRVTDTALVDERDPSTQAPRVSAQRAFWFGWYAQFPQTMLIK